MLKNKKYIFQYEFNLKKNLILNLKENFSIKKKKNLLFY